MILGLALEQETSPGKVFLPFSRDYFKRAALLAVLAQDPRPQYQDDPERVYGMAFAGLEVRFTVAGERLTVLSLDRQSPSS